MDAERLNAWIYKVVPGGRVLALVHEQALGQGLVVSSWSREEVDAAQTTGVSLGDDVLATSREHAENVNEACRFLLQWQTEVGRSIRAMVLRAAPVEPTGNRFAENADMVSGNATQAQLLSHIAQQQRTMNGAISVVSTSFGLVMAAYERALTMQQSIIETMGKRLDNMPIAGAEDETVLALKAKALEKLIEIGPDVARLGLQAARYAMGADDDGDEPKHAHTNGTGGAAAA